MRLDAYLKGLMAKLEALPPSSIARLLTIHRVQASRLKAKGMGTWNPTLSTLNRLLAVYAQHLEVVDDEKEEAP